MITHPSLLFLDEPTSGLDSKSALNVANLLRNLADNGRTVISTIHSPSSEILNTFDNVICLCKGQVIYDGPPSAVLDHFSKIGYAAPPLTNPADHLMTIIHEDDIRIRALAKGETLDEASIKRLFGERLSFFVEECRKVTPEHQIIKDQPIPFSVVTQKEITHNAFVNFFAVLGRCFRVYMRNPQSFRTKVIQTIGFVIYTIILYNKMTNYKTNTLQGKLDKTGLAFSISSIHTNSGIFANLYTFLPALGIFRRESQNKLSTDRLLSTSHMVCSSFHFSSFLSTSSCYHFSG